MAEGTATSDFAGQPLHLVLIETAGNQHYVFQSNRLRENLGASELLYQVGTRYVAETIAELGGPQVLGDDSLVDPRLLLDQKVNPPIERLESAVEIIVITSGKALLLVRGHALAKAIVGDVTRKALRDAPGVVVRGFVSPPFDWDGADLHELVGTVHRGIERLRHEVAAPEARFPLLPITAQCQSTGLPASLVQRLGAGVDPDAAPSRRHDDALSAVMHAKWLAANRFDPDASQGSSQADQRKPPRLHALLSKPGFTLVRSTKEFDAMEEIERVAVIHADGNGLGQIFLNFSSYLPEGWNNRTYVVNYRAFSLALEECTVRALREAIPYLEWRRLQKHSNEKISVVPMVPIIVGGDDLTLIVDGPAAIDFTVAFLKAFNELSKEDLGQPFGTVLYDMTNGQGLGSCAGIAVVPPHFPFHQAHDLAGELLASAKKVKEKETPTACAFDIHLVFESAVADLDDIRAQQSYEHGGKSYELFLRPYVVTAPKSPWAQRRSFEQLSKAARQLRAVNSNDPSEPLLPRGQQHWLREGLFRGTIQADGRLREIAHRYKGIDWGLMGEDDTSLFKSEERGVDDHGQPKSVLVTRLMDVLELNDIEGRGSSGGTP